MAQVSRLPRIKELPDAWVRIPATEVKKETSKAFLIHFGDKEAWMPKAWVNVGQNEDNVLCVDMPEWVRFKHQL